MIHLNLKGDLHSISVGKGASRKGASLLIIWLKGFPWRTWHLSFKRGHQHPPTVFIDVGPFHITYWPKKNTPCLCKAKS